MEYYPDSNIYRYEHGNLLGRFGGFNILNILNKDFEIIQEQDEIDIQAIEEFNSKYTMNTVEFELQDKLNEVVRAIKQLDNKIKEK